jgi:hypothetical protein
MDGARSTLIWQRPGAGQSDAFDRKATLFGRKLTFSKPKATLSGPEGPFPFEPCHKRQPPASRARIEACFSPPEDDLQGRPNPFALDRNPDDDHRANRP